MEVSVDISLYPLDKNYEPAIIAFIAKLKASPFQVVETPLSTQVYGPYDAVMDFLKEAMRETFAHPEMAVFNIRFIKGNRA